MRPSVSKFWLWAAAIGQLLAITALDYYSGYELRITAFYGVPVAFAVWYLGPGPGLLISGLAAGFSVATEVVGGEVYSEGWMPYFNGCSRLVFFLFVTLSFAYLRRTLDAAHRRIRVLSGHLPVCQCCNKVRDEHGYWSDFQAYLRDNTDVTIQPKLCPDCAREAYVNRFELSQKG